MIKQLTRFIAYNKYMMLVWHLCVKPTETKELNINNVLIRRACLWAWSFYWPNIALRSTATSTIWQVATAAGVDGLSRDWDARLSCCVPFKCMQRVCPSTTIDRGSKRTNIGIFSVGCNGKQSEYSIWRRWYYTLNAHTVRSSKCMRLQAKRHMDWMIAHCTVIQKTYLWPSGRVTLTPMTMFRSEFNGGIGVRVASHAFLPAHQGNAEHICAFIPNVCNMHEHFEHPRLYRRRALQRDHPYE